MASIKETIGTYLRDRRALAELRRLDDRMLKDIGLMGADLECAVKGKGRAGASHGDIGPK